ncbi:aldehyde dehydrogenase (NADP(+)) [Granulosicoccus antarcticus]|uniref:2,5-dioxovalerate dehydrogenase n=1 Tax=Granulosicoccus antarcticus IMCC3135 TaxID=1192854 RepID=A0A2Z2P2J1_9GAMM|nr:aldehyde dehydrogenase (NADP(+)) [Granulosicoccus antarcticus]ASJ73904.1 Alpha-ketoglutaric semialdehyde dehydrogenase [Granulosicoccus antarcticus IMCC3135]
MTYHVEGVQIIGTKVTHGKGESIHYVNPATGESLEPIFNGSTLEDVETACKLADSAFDIYRETSPEQRAAFLEAIATGIEAVSGSLIERAALESGLPTARLTGECARTCAQLRHFSQALKTGEWLGVRLATAQPDRQPLPGPDLRQRQVPLGPVAVFGASNFPLAFSVAGGDTASALAAGCPVVVKAHSAHPGASEIVGMEVQKACSEHDIPEGVFSLLYDAGFDVGQALVADPRISAVGFTGSRRGGLALMAIAQNRPVPIPVYAEMSSINPVFLLPHALTSRTEKIAQGFVGSLTMGAGQFCTNPGLVIAVGGEALEHFCTLSKQLIIDAPAQTMLTPGIHKAYVAGVDRLAGNDRAKSIAAGQPGKALGSCQAHLFRTTADAFLDDQSLQDEVFGAASIIVECRDHDQMLEVTRSLEGQLTVTLHMDDDDLDVAKSLVPVLERKAGRILVDGWPTGVEVSDPMVHGGPFPATSDARTTSVGSAAIARFLRPVCYQSFPSALLPTELRDDNPRRLSRLVDGARVAAD